MRHKTFYTPVMLLLNTGVAASGYLRSRTMYSDFCEQFKPLSKLISEESLHKSCIEFSNGVPSVLLLGHSFVRHLRRYMKPRTPSKSKETKSGDKTYLDLDLRRVCNVHILTEGGRMIKKTISYDWEQIRPLKPNIVVIKLGCNDLSEPRWETKAICEAMDGFVGLLFSNIRVQFVVVCKTIHCLSPLLFDGYNAGVDAFNAGLSMLFANNPRVTVWQHHRLINSSPNVSCKDGLHLNYQGNKTLYKSYRRPILHALFEMSKCS